MIAIVEREDSGYVTLCPDADVAGQGDSAAEARQNLAEALSLFFGTDPWKNRRWLHNQACVTPVEFAGG